MSEGVKRGFAFVFEGETEQVFYRQYLKYCVALTPGATFRSLAPGSYEVFGPSGVALIETLTAGSVASVPNSLQWVTRKCQSARAERWTAVLCYDTDGDESRNQQSVAWKRFRADLSRLRVDVIDLAADADIEDVMLCDLEGVRGFLSLQDDVTPHGKKGKARMKSLYKAADPIAPYHSGRRALPLIQALDFGRIEDEAPIPLRDLRAALTEAVG